VAYFFGPPWILPLSVRVRHFENARTLLPAVDTLMYATNNV